MIPFGIGQGGHSRAFCYSCGRASEHKFLQLNNKFKSVVNVLGGGAGRGSWMALLVDDLGNVLRTNIESRECKVGS